MFDEAGFSVKTNYAYITGIDSGLLEFLNIISISNANFMYNLSVQVKVFCLKLLF